MTPDGQPRPRGLGRGYGPPALRAFAPASVLPNCAWSYGARRDGRDTAPPSFIFFTNVATTFHFSYERFLVNQLRENFGFMGSPIRVQVRRRDQNSKVGGPRKDRGGRTVRKHAGSRLKKS